LKRDDVVEVTVGEREVGNEKFDRLLLSDDVEAVDACLLWGEDGG
jgi:hypothetical protein